MNVLLQIELLCSRGALEVAPTETGGSISKLGTRDGSEPVRPGVAAEESGTASSSGLMECKGWNFTTGTGVRGTGSASSGSSI